MSISPLLEESYTSLSGSLLSGLRSKILQGGLADGDKISEQAVCNEFHVSRTPVREALRQLETEGLVQIYPNRGAFVSGFSTQDLKDLYAMRREFEVLAAGWAAQRITDEELEKISESLELMSFYTFKNDPDKMMKVNMDFHTLIHQASHNSRLANVLAIYQTFLTESKANHKYLKKDMSKVLAEHKKIIDAIMARDAEGAKEAMRLHLEGATERAFAE